MYQKGFGSIKLYIYLALGAAALGFAFFVWNLWTTNQTLVAEKGKLEQALSQRDQTIKDQEMQISDLRQEAERLDALLVVRQLELKRVIEERDGARDDLDDYIRNAPEPEVREWADTLIPIGIYQRLFELPSGTSSYQDSGGETAPASDIDAGLPFTRSTEAKFSRYNHERRSDQLCLASKSYDQIL